jgi:hypothetical protein
MNKDEHDKIKQEDGNYKAIFTYQSILKTSTMLLPKTVSFDHLPPEVGEHIRLTNNYVESTGETKTGSWEEIDNYQTIRDNIEISQMRGKVYDMLSCREEFSIEFNCNYFFKFLLYHIIYFFLLGPIFGLILTLCGHYKLAKNMSFIGISLTSFLQFNMYMVAGPGLFISIYLKLFNPDIVKNVSVFEVTFCILTILIRIIIVASRYALTTRQMVEARYNRLLTKEDFGREFILSGWRDVSKEICDDEVIKALAMMEIDIELFTYSTISQLDDDWLNRLSLDSYFESKKPVAHVHDHNSGKRAKIDFRTYSTIKPLFTKIKKEKLKIGNSTFYVKPKTHHDPYRSIILRLSYKFKQIRDVTLTESRSIEDELNLPTYLKRPEKEFMLIHFPGRLLARELLIFARDSKKSYFKHIIKLVIILHLLIPIGYRALMNQSPVGETPLEIILIAFITVTHIITFLISMLFIETGGNDYNRKLQMMKYLHYLIIPNKLNIKSNELRVLPTINIFCIQSIKTWMYLRIVIPEIGKRYTRRAEAYTSIFMITYGLVLVTIILGFLGVFKYFKPTDPDYQLFYILGLLQVFITSMVLFRMVYLGVENNKYFRTHIYQLNLIKESFIDLIQNYQQWKEMDLYTNQYLEMAKRFFYSCRDFHKSDRLKEEYYNLVDRVPEIDDHSFVKHFKKLVKEIEDIIRRLELEEKDRPLRLLGIKLTEEFLSQLIIGIVTLLFTIFQYVFTMNTV